MGNGLHRTLKIVKSRRDFSSLEYRNFMRAFAVLRLAGNSSVLRNPVCPLLPRANPIAAAIRCERQFGATAWCYRYRPVTEEEWTITKEEWEEEGKLVRSVRNGIWAGQNGRMLNAPD